MCLLAIAIGASTRWPLVIASNRDEYRDRPTLPLAVWKAPGDVTVLSGRDLRAGGTWLGCTPSGRVALLTNVREAEPATAPLSRGNLPVRWLEGQLDAADFLATCAAESYGGCNLVLGDFGRGEWTWACNRGDLLAGAARLNSHRTASGWQTMTLTPGLYGLSNALIDTPWPKTQALKAAMQTALTQAELSDDESALTRDLWAALANPERAARHDLPNTGIAAELEHALSSALIDLPERAYGTRCSTLMWVAAQTAAGSFRLSMSEKTLVSQVQITDAVAATMVQLSWPLRL
jgi:uncharacterized protein with NRDE domain